MKLRNRSMLLAGIAISGAAQAVTVFTEDFEYFDAFVPATGFLPAAGPAAFGPFWNLTSGTVDLIRNCCGAIDGISLDLSGTGPGTISRSFDWSAGNVYTLTWDYFRNVDGPPGSWAVTLGGSSSTGGAPLDLFRGASLVWTAPLTGSGAETVSFSGTGIGFGTTIDNIVLTAVPEPGPLALMLMGLGVVGFLARNRLNAR